MGCHPFPPIAVVLLLALLPALMFPSMAAAGEGPGTPGPLVNATQPKQRPPLSPSLLDPRRRLDRMRTGELKRPQDKSPPPLAKTALAPAINCPSGDENTVTLAQQPDSEPLDITSTITAGKTFILQAGYYAIKSTIKLGPYWTTCIRGESRSSVTIMIDTGNATEAGRAFRITRSQLRLERLVLYGQGQAPAIAAEASQVELEDVDVVECAGSEDVGGAGIWATGASSVRVTNAAFTGNTAQYGAALAIEDGPALYMKQVNVISNLAAGPGGGIYFWAAGDVVFEDTRFSGNRASAGGAVELLYTGASFINSVFLGNPATYYGGAVDAYSASAVSLTFSGTTVFSGNTATFGGGGALACGGETHVSFDGSTTLSYNTAVWQGGAVHVSDYGRSTVTFKGSTTVTSNAVVGANNGVSIVSGQGGAFWIGDEPLISVEGSMCASNNGATSDGGFAWVAGELRMADAATLNLYGNTPDTISIAPDVSGQVFCGSSSSSAWREGTSYDITGPACAAQCDAAFSDATANVTSCDTCSFGWSPSSCGCAKSPDSCTSGSCCDTTTQTFLPNGTACSIDDLVRGLARSSHPAKLARAAGYDPSRPDPYYREGDDTTYSAPDEPSYAEYPEHPRQGDGGYYPDHTDNRHTEYTGPPTTRDQGPGPQQGAAGHRDPHHYGSYGGPDRKDGQYYKQDKDKFAPYRPSAGLRECKGACSSGHCKLDVSRPGCCYPPAAQAALLAQRYSEGRAAPEGYGGRAGGRQVLCWGEDEGNMSYALY